MLLTREKNILTLLIDNDEKLTTSQIAVDLNVSSRTIKADIKKINSELEKSGCRICSCQGVGVWIEYDNSDAKQYLRELMFSKNPYMAPDIRKYHLAVELLLYDDYTSMEMLAGKYYISKATVLNDFEGLTDFWEKFNIKFIKKVKYGIKIEGSENQIRLALIEALKKTSSVLNASDNMKLHFPNIDVKVLKDILYQLETRFQFVITDVSLDELIIALAVMIKRLESNQVFDRSEDNDTGKNTGVEIVSTYLKESLSDELGINIPDEEDQYINMCISGLKFQVPMENGSSLEDRKEQNVKLYDTVVHILKACDEKFYSDLENDKSLIESLMNHMECLLHRINSQLYTCNPILKIIKNELFYEYEVATYFVDCFSSLYNVEVTEDEIGFVAFHIGASIERVKQEKQNQYTATIVCTTGFGTSQFLKVKLGSYFNNIKIIKTLSASRTSQIKADEQDFIITTVPIQIKDIPVVHISPVLKDNDINKIQKFLKDIKGNTNLNKYATLKRFLRNETSILGCDLKTKEEAITLMATRLISKGYVDDGFADSVFQRENLSETAVGNLIAIPHAYEGHILKQGIGLITLKKPITWGDEKVQVVFMLSLDGSSKDYIKGIFEDVYELSKDKKELERFIGAESFTDIIK